MNDMKRRQLAAMMDYALRAEAGMPRDPKAAGIGRAVKMLLKLGYDFAPRKPGPKGSGE